MQDQEKWRREGGTGGEETKSRSYEVLGYKLAFIPIWEAYIMKILW